MININLISSENDHCVVNECFDILNNLIACK